MRPMSLSWLFLAACVVSAFCAFAGFGEIAAFDIAVADRKSLTADKLVCERISLGEADDYKPCIAQLPSGELLLTAFHQHKR